MKQNYIRRGLFLAICILIVLFIFIKNSGSQDEIVLKFGMFAGSYWDVPNGNCFEIIDHAIKKFESEHEGVRVEYQSGVLKDDYSEWFSRKLILGEDLDVFFILDRDFNTFASIGVMKNLDELIKKDKSFDQSKFYKSAYRAGQYQGQQYALPYESVPTMMFVNKTLLEREGLAMPENNWTWDDFYEICKAVTKDTNGDGRLDQFGSFDYTWRDAAYSNGAQLFNESGTKSYFRSEPVTESVNFVKKLQELNQDERVTAEKFDNGDVAFRPFQFSQYRTYMPYPWRVKKYSQFEWDCIKMPAGPAGDNISQLSSLLMGISGNTKQEKLAWEFLKMLTYDEEIQMMIFDYSQGVSVIKGVTESEEAIENLIRDTPGESKMDMSLLSQVMEQSSVAPKFQRYNEAMTIADNEIDQIITGVKGIDSTLFSLQKEINKFLKK